MGHLLREVTAGHAIRHPTQLGIEVPVPQITGADRKTQVCKDVVIWPEPRMTCWDVAQQPTVPPIGILEWKFPSRRVYSGDVEWLRSFSRMHPACTGYAISADLPGGAFRLSCTRVSGGIAEPEWLVIR
jgi:hypothetical protein